MPLARLAAHTAHFISTRQHLGEDTRKLVSTQSIHLKRDGRFKIATEFHVPGSVAPHCASACESVPLQLLPAVNENAAVAALCAADSP